MFRRVLVANRGEIARRVLRTCRAMGIETVAVHSDVDAGEPHVLEADRAVLLGPAPAARSYLDIERVIAAVAAVGADAVHPGYGFLAESAAFARAVAEAGATFVGPSPEVIELMGDKAAAKRRLEAAGVPVVPGVHAEEALDDDAALAAAEQVGLPLLVKAVAGGGGKGMRTVDDLERLPDALAAARREARAAFGDDRVLLERLVRRPRHVEVQVLGDAHGHVIHLLERECSVQRRHQKVVEEAPSPVVDQDLREQLGAAAVTAAAEVGYEGAGTVELLLAGDTADSHAPEFYFLEMNTRLQVEHPVTELVTGLDLVELQLRVAAGQRLPLAQEEVRAAGHALEARLYAEDPVSMLPQTGEVIALRLPEAEDVRVDAGIEAGSHVSRHYDPLLAKLVVHGADRAASCERMSWLLRHTSVHGVVTNLELLAAVVEHPAFVAGELTTAFLDEHLAEFTLPPAPDASLVAAAVALLRDAQRPRSGGGGPWTALGPFRLGMTGGWRLALREGDREAALSVAGRGTGWRVCVDDRELDVRLPSPPGTDGRMQLEIDGRGQPALATVVDDADADTLVWVHAEGTTRRLEVVPPVRHAGPGAAAGVAAFTSPMPGTVLSVGVAEGEHVPRGTTLVVVEAMKMEHPIVAPADGAVTAVHVRVGDPVEDGTPLVAFEPQGE